MHPLAPHRRPPFPRLLLYNPLLMLLGYLFLALAARVRAEEKPYTPTVHTVFGCECGGYFNWQSIGMIYSHKKSGQPGPLTRLLSCTPEEAKHVKLMDVVTTHIAPSLTINPHNNDIYSAYNKPGAVIDWLKNNDIKEDFVLILDADMLMRGTFTPDEFGAEKGHPVSAFYGYLKGVANDLALKHIPEVPPTNDFEAGPYGRRGDQVGGFILMQTEDLKRMAPMWLSFAEKVRFDPDAWNLTGDVYAEKEPHSRPWISEMYGYSYGAAKAGLHHRLNHHAMLYPEYQPRYAPRVLHYGLFYEIPNTGYKFDKHWYRSFDPFNCDWSQHNQRDFLFPNPPKASTLKSTGSSRLRDLLGVETPATLNEAVCWWHRHHCPQMSDASRKQCEVVQEIADDLDREYKELGPLAELAPGIEPCEDETPKDCPGWSKAGECKTNSAFMMQSCRRSCGACVDGETLHRRALEAHAAAEKKEKGFAGGLTGVVSAMKGKIAAAAARNHIAVQATGPSVHTVFVSGCVPYFDWQGLGLKHSHEAVGMPGPLTRILACTEEQAKNVQLIETIQTHHAPPHTAPSPDADSAVFGRAAAIEDWLAKKEVKEDFILIVDPDFYFKGVVTPAEFGAEQGRPVAAALDSLSGVAGRLADKLLPGAPQIKDTEGGPYGRKADQVGPFYLIHKTDLRKVLPLWRDLAAQVLGQPDASDLVPHLGADRGPGSLLRVADLYGYTFAAAQLGLRHRVSRYGQGMPEQPAMEPPRVVHYGPAFEVQGFTFDKLAYHSFNPVDCQLSITGGSLNFTLPIPPKPSALTSTGREKVGDLIALETVSVLNEAICSWHSQNCEMSDEARKSCQTVSDYGTEVREGYNTLGAGLHLAAGIDPCRDDSGAHQCAEWSRAGKCETEPERMAAGCRQTCKLCGAPGAGRRDVGGILKGNLQRRAADARSAQNDATVQEAEALVHKQLAKEDADRDTRRRRQGQGEEGAKEEEAKEEAKEEGGDSEEGGEGKEDKAEGGTDGTNAGEDQADAARAAGGFGDGTLRGKLGNLRNRFRRRTDLDSDLATFQQPSFFTGLEGALRKFARTSVSFLIVLIVLVVYKLVSRRKSAAARQQKMALPLSYARGPASFKSGPTASKRLD